MNAIRLTRVLNLLPHVYNENDGVSYRVRGHIGLGNTKHIYTSIVEKFCKRYVRFNRIAKDICVGLHPTIATVIPVILRNCIKVSMAIVVIVGVFSGFIAPRNLHANEVSVSERWKQLLDLYIKNEFSNGNIKLRKFELVGAIAIVIECGSLEQSVCQDATQVLNETFEPSANLRLIPSPLGVISIIFDNNAHVESMLPIAVKDYASGVSDTSDRQCAMFYKYAESTIQKGKIFVSTDQPSNKLRACLIVQIGRLLGPGFSQSDRFSDIWSGLLSRSTDDKLKQIAHIYGILEYMHMCPELVAGMSEGEARRALLRPDGCMSKLEEIK